MNHVQLQMAISAGFRAFRALDKEEQAAVLAAVELFQRTHRRTSRNWPAEMLAAQLMKESETRK